MRRTCKSARANLSILRTQLHDATGCHVRASVRMTAIKPVGADREISLHKAYEVAWCHCQSCRKHSGAPVSVFVAFRRDAYAVTKGEITKFNSSPGRWRGFAQDVGPP